VIGIVATMKLMPDISTHWISLLSFLGVFLLFCMSIAGCLYRDATMDPVAEGISNRQFELVQDSILYQTVCVPISKFLTGSSYCDTVQHLGDEPCFAPNAADYYQHQSFWDEKLRKCAHDGDGAAKQKVLVYGLVTHGTSIKITEVASVQLGETGRCWFVAGQLEDGQYAGRRVLLPSCNHIGVSWLRQAAASRMPEIKSEFLRAKDQGAE